MFWGLDLEWHLMELSQYADTQLDHHSGQVEELQIAPHTLRGKSWLRRGAVLGTVEETIGSTIGY